ncbi:hypothetical protein GCM10010521_34250 [Streptomyces rameus]|uniref:Uncharacterized protein n=1 Tax=Streptomyces rameus TaxID=68261 RepID=A0ABP6NDD8_9ACTN
MPFAEGAAPQKREPSLFVGVYFENPEQAVQDVFRWKTGSAKEPGE